MDNPITWVVLGVFAVACALIAVFNYGAHKGDDEDDQ